MSLRRKLQPYKAPAGPLPTPAALASLLLLGFTYIPLRAFLLAWPAALHSLTSTAKILRSLLRFRLFREILLPHLYKMIPRPTCRFIHFYSRTPRFFSIALETSRFFFFYQQIIYLLTFWLLSLECKFHESRTVLFILYPHFPGTQEYSVQIFVKRINKWWMHDLFSSFHKWYMITSPEQIRRWCLAKNEAPLSSIMLFRKEG